VCFSRYRAVFLKLYLWHLNISIQSISAVQIAKDVDTVVFDKTGTLTAGALQVKQAFMPRADVLPTIFTLVSGSHHPVSQSLVRYLHTLEADISPITLKDVESVPGRGITARLDGHLVRGGSPAWLGIESHSAVVEMQTHALTLFAVTLDSEVLAIFGLSDSIRPGVYEAVRTLQKQGCEIYIVSGDGQPVVSSLANQLGLNSELAYGGALPQTKLERVRSLQQEGKKVMFVGDGTNDSLALAQADIGVSLGSGTDIALSAADVVLLDTADFARAMQVLRIISFAAVRRIAINFIWAFVYTTRERNPRWAGFTNSDGDAGLYTW
jgi:Cd2+-exporting ATPase